MSIKKIISLGVLFVDLGLDPAVVDFNGVGEFPFWLPAGRADSFVAEISGVYANWPFDVFNFEIFA